MSDNIHPADAILLAKEQAASAISQKEHILQQADQDRVARVAATIQNKDAGPLAVGGAQDTSHTSQSVFAKYITDLEDGLQSYVTSLRELEQQKTMLPIPLYEQRLKEVDTTHRVWAYEYFSRLFDTTDGENFDGGFIAIELLSQQHAARNVDNTPNLTNKQLDNARRQLPSKIKHKNAAGILDWLKYESSDVEQYVFAEMFEQLVDKPRDISNNNDSRVISYNALKREVSAIRNMQSSAQTAQHAKLEAMAADAEYLYKLLQKAANIFELPSGAFGGDNIALQKILEKVQRPNPFSWQQASIGKDRWIFPKSNNPGGIF